MRQVLYFLFAFCVCVMAFLVYDIEAHMPRVFAISAVLAAITVLIVKLVRKPIKRWYLRNFDRVYMANRGYVNGRKIK